MFFPGVPSKHVFPLLIFIHTKCLSKFACKNNSCRTVSCMNCTEKNACHTISICPMIMDGKRFF